MAPLKSIAALCTLSLLAGCGGSPEAQFNSGCHTMMKRQDDVVKEERRIFCSCLADDTKELSDEDRKTLGILMKEADDGQELRLGIEETHQNDELSVSGAALFFSAAKTCSLDFAV